MVNLKIMVQMAFKILIIMYMAFALRDYVKKDKISSIDNLLWAILMQLLTITI